jgi:16S rRNA U1498 N3-methylase RsmE
MSEQAGVWYPYEEGATIRQIGPEGGFVQRDEEFGDPAEPEDADVRLTLEQGRAENPGYFLTANLYGGWLYHVARRASEADALTLFDAVKPELARLAEMLPMEDDRNVEAKAKLLVDAAAAFEQRFA